MEYFGSGIMMKEFAILRAKGTLDPSQKSRSLLIKELLYLLEIKEHFSSGKFLKKLSEMLLSQNYPH